jgi:hypothetical protein
MVSFSIKANIGETPAFTRFLKVWKKTDMWFQIVQKFFLSIQTYKLLFLDSMQFLPTGLDSLVKTLAEVRSQISNIKRTFWKKVYILNEKECFSLRIY